MDSAHRFNFIHKASRSQLNVHSTIDVHNSDWIDSLRIRWEEQQKLSPPTKKHKRHKSLSPRTRRKQRAVIEIDDILFALQKHLPPSELTAETNSALLRLSRAVLPHCSAAQKQQFDELCTDRYTSQTSRHLHNILTRQPIAINKLCEVPPADWRIEHLRKLICDADGELNGLARELSIPLIQTWTPLEPRDNVLRMDGPLRQLLKLWVELQWSPVPLDSIQLAMVEISRFPARLKDILRIQCHELEANELENEASRGVLLVRFLCFSCFFNRIEDRALRNQLLQELRKLPITDSFYLLARESISGNKCPIFV